LIAIRCKFLLHLRNEMRSSNLSPRATLNVFDPWVRCDLDAPVWFVERKTLPTTQQRSASLQVRTGVIRLPSSCRALMASAKIPPEGFNP
jgi:hypothetical protein